MHACRENRRLRLATYMTAMPDFYDQLAPRYHLIYRDWDAGIAAQAADLEKIIRSQWGNQVSSLLDVSCGIGTQAIGLRRLGFDVTASDLSAAEIERAEQEASVRGLDIRFSVCDMRNAAAHHGTGFDLAISCDNSITHLLSDGDIVRALKQIHACLRPGGGCLLTVRDYDREERGTGLVKPYGTRDVDGKRVLIFQVWDFDDDYYDLSMYFVEDDRNGEVKTRVMRSRYYAISTGKLLDLMRQAGFERVERLDDRFYQPVLVGTRPAR
jgi:SAM-dependent methyltransferase